MSILHGVIVTPLDPKPDSRGVLTEVFRAQWPTACAPVQWNVVRSRANVMRGFHVHITHADYLIALSGELLLGLRDIRPESPTWGRTDTVRLSDERTRAVTVPPGVAHGFYFAEPSMHLYAVSHYWNTADELGCRWNDPDIGIDWPATAPELSERDINAGAYSEMVESFLRGRAEAQARA